MSGIARTLAWTATLRTMQFCRFCVQPGDGVLCPCSITRRYSRWMMPVVLIVLGLYIIDRSGLVFGQPLL
ncbi:hypothetical protein [Nocardia sp. NPDC004860]|uniref:hypothetical protein n=1 Tax=Nocardia sp. NPDC004860 TaxID=3154557 RepID=UPI0033B2801D